MTATLSGPVTSGPATRDTGSSGRASRSAPVWLAVLATSLPMFMATLDNLVMTTALPVVQADLDATVGELSWFVNAYTLAFATFMLPAATLGDRLGRRRVMLLGLTVFTGASIASALSQSAEALIAARAVQGFGAAAIMPLSLTLLAAAVPASRRALAIGIWGGVSGLGVALGPVVGGAVVEGLSWQAIFWLNVPVALVTIPLLRMAVAESRDVPRPAGPRGDGAAGRCGVPRRVGHHPRQRGRLGLARGRRVARRRAAPAPGVPVVGTQPSPRDPAAPPVLLALGSPSPNALGLFFTLGMFGAVFLLSQNLQIVMGYSPLEAGVRTLPWTAAPMVVAPIAGALVSRTGLRALLVPGLVLQAGSLVWMAALTESASSYASMVPALAMAGIGMGLTFAPSATAVSTGWRSRTSPPPAPPTPRSASSAWPWVWRC